MEKIYICTCDGDCGTIVMGFVNGKISMLPEGLSIVEFELQFMRNVTNG